VLVLGWISQFREFPLVAIDSPEHRARVSALIRWESQVSRLALMHD
jgi:hypothetical protein